MLIHFVEKITVNVFGRAVLYFLFDSLTMFTVYCKVNQCSPYMTSTCSNSHILKFENVLIILYYLI